MNKGSRNILVPAAALFITSIVGALHATEALAAWPTSTATRCWSFGSTTEKMKMRINPVGDGFSNVNFILVGEGNIRQISSGTAYIRGSYVYMTFTSAGKDSEGMWTIQQYVTINNRTMIGEFESIGHDKNYTDGSLDTEYEASPITLSPVSCATIWQ